jgi:hypothetical protein
LSSSIVIHVLRPYANEDDYLASERHSIDSKSMLLIDQPPLPLETSVVFDVQLENGQKPIRAEAKVIGHVAATPGKPGGLRVRFKRFGAATKSFIDRAIASPLSGSSSESGERPASVRPAPSLVPILSASSAREPIQVDQPAEEVALSVRPVKREAGESSGIHRRPVVPVAAPLNREELLERLRSRARSSLAHAADSNPGEQTGKAPVSASS